MKVCKFHAVGVPLRPLAGPLLAVLLFKLIKSLEYESANPDPKLGPAANSTRPVKGSLEPLSYG